VPYIVRILDQNRAAAFALATARCNWSQGGAWGDQGEAARGLGRAGALSEDALTIAELEEEGTPSRALLRSPLPPKMPLGEFTNPRRPRRARPRRRRLAVAPGLPHQCSGHGATARCVTPPPSSARATVSRPRLDQQPRLEREIPLHIFNLNRNLRTDGSHLMRVRGLMDRPPWT
jgi:hypothetical protein